jgi:hypothetical protein
MYWLQKLYVLVVMKRRLEKPAGGPWFEKVLRYLIWYYGLGILVISENEEQMIEDKVGVEPEASLSECVKDS